ncbi:hypothetical protein ACFYOD_35825 [Streptomyces sp. NPDC006703]|uniref:hypothetical protein n=1 Tax=Streptomyces sp. NPDC006703 TaxID=3364759 RepID=UPI0036CB5EBD
MKAGEKLEGRGAYIVMTLAIAVEAASTEMNGPQAAMACCTALIAAGAWTFNGRHTGQRGVSGGRFAQAMTWDRFVRPHKAPRDDDSLHTAFARRMRQTDHYVPSVTAQHGLKQISIALPSSTRDGGFDDARSIRHTHQGHLWLGHRWFHPDHTHHLPSVLEHELAHLRRNDTRTRQISETAAVAATALAAGLLPLPAFAAAALTTWLGDVAVRWWGELACDAHAMRRCGRAAVTAMWNADLARARTAPRRIRTWAALRALRWHPPLRLRRAFARHWY